MDHDNARSSIKPIDNQIFDDLNNLYNCSGKTIVDQGKFLLVEAVKLTGSEAGYFAFMSDDEKTIRKTLLYNPSIEDSPQIAPEELTDFPVEQATFLAESIRQRKATLVNNFHPDEKFSTLENLYRADVKRQITIPLVYEDHIEVVFGLANKKENYTEKDIYLTTIFAEGIWHLHQRMKFDETHCRLLSIVEHSNDAIIGSTLDEKITSWNKGAENIFGYTAGEVLGEKLEILCFPDMPNELPLIFDRILMGQNINHYETVRMKKNGERIDVSLTASPIIDLYNNITGVSFIARDFTEKKKTEKELKMSELLYRTIFENTGTGSIIIGEDAIIKKVNKEFEKLLGYTKEEIEGKMTGADFVVERDIPKIVDYHKLRRMDPEKAPRNYEYSLQYKNGPIKNIYVTTAVIPGTKESIASFMDITEIKKLQREVLDVCDNERRTLVQQLHDGVVPKLTDISFIAEELKSGNSSLADSEKNKLLKITELVDESINRSECISCGISMLNFKTDNFFKAIEKLVASLKQIYDVSCTLKYERDLTVDNDIIANNLYFIVQESTVNAIKHASAKNISISISSEKDWISLTVSDDGIGIPERGDRKKGLGLQIMNYRASIIGAFIEIKAVETGGTEVTCRYKNKFDVSENFNEELTVRGTFPRLKDKSKILIVEKQPIVRHGLIEIINNDENLIVCGEADNPDQAIKYICRHNPDLVILDVSVESGIGINVIKAITDRFNKLPVLVISVNDEKVYAERVLRMGAKGYVMKYDSTDVILKAIHHILNGRVYLNEEIKKRIFDRTFEEKIENSLSPVDILTDRELEVFQLIGRGFGPRCIAEKLSLSVKTVETYRERIKEKLRLGNAAELLQFAIQWLITSINGEDYNS